MVTIYGNLEDRFLDGALWFFWFLLDMEETLWTKMYTLQGTQFGYGPFVYSLPLSIDDFRRWEDSCLGAEDRSN
jgi:hypothetical protein